MNTRRRMWKLPVAGVLAAAFAVQAQVKVDPNLKTYTAGSGVSGNIKSVGSDTMNNLMTLWAEKYIAMYPNVRVEIEGKGSATAPAALVAGAANFGPMSRAMKSTEEDTFEKKYGHKPTQLRTAIDMLAVYVHKDNPIAQKGLTLPELDAIFSTTRKGGLKDAITTWGQLGMTGEWASKPISLYGRNSASGTYGYFKEHALFNGDFKDGVKEQPGSSSVVQGIAGDKFAIGYSGIGYKTADVAVVPIAAKPGGEPVPASPDDVGKYPLARFLYTYINHKPGSQLDPLRKEFVKLIFSAQGQEVVIKDGFLPVNAKIAAQELKKIGVDMEKEY
ncbi:MAG TPA: phosphate-binding protein [Planctomycetes bacterium]|nr:phosphate-binding protein [Planctomycetota bacterium]